MPRSSCSDTSQAGIARTRIALWRCICHFVMAFVQTPCPDPVCSGFVCAGRSAAWSCWLQNKPSDRLLLLCVLAGVQRLRAFLKRPAKPGFRSHSAGVRAIGTAARLSTHLALSQPPQAGREAQPCSHSGHAFPRSLPGTSVGVASGVTPAKREQNTFG